MPAPGRTWKGKGYLPHFKIHTAAVEADALRLTINDVVQKKLEWFKQFVRDKNKVVVIGPPRSGKTRFIKALTETGHTEISIVETVPGFIEGENDATESLVKEVKKNNLREAIMIIANLFRRQEEIRRENLFEFWISEDEINLGTGSFEWVTDEGRVIRYHPPGLLLKIKNLEEYKKQIELYKLSIEIFGIKDRRLTVKSVGEVMTGVLAQMADDIASLMSSLAGFLGGAVFAVVPLIMVVNLLAKGEKEASTALLKLVTAWKEMDEETKRILASRIAYEIGLKSVSGRDLVYSTLENLSGINYEKLALALENISKQIDSLRSQIAEVKEELLKEIEARRTEGTRELKNVNEVARYLRIPADRLDRIVRAGEVDEIANAVLKGADEGVSVITGHAGSGKSTLLYVVSERLIGAGKRVFAVEDLQTFKPLEFAELRNAYAILDVTDPEKARGLRERLEKIRDPSLLSRLIIAIRDGFVDGGLKRLFKRFRVVELRYSKDTLMEIAKRELRSSFPGLSEGDLVRYSSLLVSKSEGLPIYIVEATKYAKETGDVEAVSRLPIGIRSLVVNIFGSEVEELGGAALLLYYIVSHYPGIPEEYFRDIVSLLQLKSAPRYIESSRSALFLHSWYRVVIDDIVSTEGATGLEDVGELVRKIRDSLSESVLSLSNSRVVSHYFERVYSLLVPRDTVPRKLREGLERVYDKFREGVIKTEDAADLLILVSLLHFAKTRLHKRTGGGFDMLREGVDYSNLSANDVDLYFRLSSFFANSYLSRDSIGEAIAKERPLFYTTLLFLSRLFKNEFTDSVAGYFIEGDRKIDMTLEKIRRYSRILVGDYVTRDVYIPSLVMILEKLGYFSVEGPADRAVLYYLKKDYESALIEINKALSIDPSNPKYYKIRGDILYRLKRYEEALKEYDMAIRLDPDNPDYHNDRGNALAGLKRYEEAIREYDTAIRLNPNDPRFHYNKALELKKLKRYKEALDEIEQAIRLNPNDPTYYWHKGVVLRELGLYKAALDEIEQAIRLNPNDASNHNSKAITLEELGQYEEALKEYDIAIGLEPHEPNYHNNKADLLNKLGRYEEALNEVEIALRLNPNDPFYHSTKAVALAHLGNCGEALEEVDRTLKLTNEAGTDITQEDIEEIQKDINEVKSICSRNRT